MASSSKREAILKRGYGGEDLLRGEMCFFFFQKLCLRISYFWKRGSMYNCRFRNSILVVAEMKKKNWSGRNWTKNSETFDIFL